MDITSITKSAYEYIGYSVFKKLFLNPIYVSILITISILLIVLLIFDDNHIIKTGFYMFFVTLCIVFVHNNLLLIKHKTDLCDKNSEDICNVIGSNEATIGGVEELRHLQI